jgi:pimeloyl-ACP methyl ester carboxylesterase
MRTVRAPSLIIHGALDPLIPVEAGRDVAACIPGAGYLELPDIGHYFPRHIWPVISDAIAELTDSADQAR